METKTRIAGIIIQDGKLLMLRGQKPELWTPGGKLEVGESDEECLKRELKEEIGVELVRASFFREYIAPGFYNPSVLVTQRVYITEVSGAIMPSAEINDYVWFTKEDFKNRSYPMITTIEKRVIPDLISKGVW